MVRVSLSIPLQALLSAGASADGARMVLGHGHELPASCEPLTSDEVAPYW